MLSPTSKAWRGSLYTVRPVHPGLPGRRYQERMTPPKCGTPEGPLKHVVVHTAPSIRVGIGEELPSHGHPCHRQAVALHRLGLQVFDTNFAADLTIMEEGTELLPSEEQRRAAHDHLLLPGGSSSAKPSIPSLSPTLSTCKSPMSWRARSLSPIMPRMRIDPKDIGGRRHALYRQEV